MSSIAKCFTKNLPSTIEGCIIRAPDTQQEWMLLGILGESGMLLSETTAEVYSRQHLRCQEERPPQEAKRRGHGRESY
jgi:hypothetical protein